MQDPNNFEQTDPGGRSATDGRPSVTNTYHLAMASGDRRPACGASLVKYVSPLPTTNGTNVNCPDCLALMGKQVVVPISSLPKFSDSYWEHDCANCMYLGSVKNNGLSWDLYVAQPQLHHGTLSLVARYGSEPGDYLSGFDFVDREPLLALAYVKAVKQGHLPPDTIK